MKKNSPVKNSFENIKNSAIIGRRLGISNEKEDEYYKIAKGLFDIRYPLIEEKYIGSIKNSFNDNQLSIIAGIKQNTSQKN